MAGADVFPPGWCALPGGRCLFTGRNTGGYCSAQRSHENGSKSTSGFWPLERSVECRQHCEAQASPLSPCRVHHCQPVQDERDSHVSFRQRGPPGVVHHHLQPVPGQPGYSRPRQTASCPPSLFIAVLSIRLHAVAARFAAAAQPSVSREGRHRQERSSSSSRECRRPGARA